MNYPCKGRFWLYWSYFILFAFVTAFVLAFLHFGYMNLNVSYQIFLPCFLAACVFQVYTMTPLLSPKLAGLMVLVIFAASQVMTILFLMGHFFSAYILGHIAELGAFAWAYSKARALYEQQPL